MIPLPTSIDNHQYFNAVFYEENDQGKIFQEKDSLDSLANLISRILHEKIYQDWKKNEPPIDHLTAASIMFSEIHKISKKFDIKSIDKIEDLKKCIRKGTLSSSFVPVFCGSAFKNKGVQAVLDAAIEYLPAPNEVKAIKGSLPSDEEIEVSRSSSDEEPFSALAFKIATDPFVGTLTFIRVYSGVLSVGDGVMNATKEKKERVGRMVQMHSNDRNEIKEIRAGDIAACIGLKDVTTGDTLCDLKDQVVLERMDFPEPVISVAVEPKTKADQEKMGVALGKLAQEDPSFRVHTCLLYTSPSPRDVEESRMAGWG